MSSRIVLTRLRSVGFALGGALGLIAAATLAAAPPVAAASPGGYAVSRISTARDPYGIGVDAATGTVYITGSEAQSVFLVSAATNAVTKTVSLDTRPIALAVDSLTHKVYVSGFSTQAQSTITVLDGSSGAVLATIPTASYAQPGQIAVNQATDTIYYVDGRHNVITVINGGTNQITGTVAVTAGATLNGLAVDQSTNTIYVTGFYKIGTTVTAGLWAVDGMTNVVGSTIDLGNGQNPNGGAAVVAVDDATDTVYATSPAGPAVQVIDGSAGVITATISSIPAHGIAVDPSSDTIYVAGSGNPAGKSTVIDGATGAVTASLPRGGVGVAVDPATGAAYIASDNAEGDTWVITPSSATVVSPFIPFQQPADFSTGTAGSCTFQASATPAATFSETGQLPDGLTLSPSGTLAGTPAAGTGGQYNITVTAGNGIAPSDSADFTVVVDQPTAFTSAAQATFHVGSSQTFEIDTTGYPPWATISEAGTLPAGISFGNDGPGYADISGTPAAGTTGTYKITFTATGGDGTVTQAFTLTVDQPPKFRSASTATFKGGAKGSFTVQTSGVPTAQLSYTGKLPGGLTFKAGSNGTATISGTAFKIARGKKFAITITAHSSAGTAKQTLTIKVS